MKKILYSVIFLAIFYALEVFSQEFGTRRILETSLRGENYTIFKPTQGKIFVLGELTKTTLEALQTTTKDTTVYKDLIVDSQGGDAESALEIADIINRLNLRLIVDGRCFSACANFLFPAAKRKIVLRSGIVGIHQIQVNFLDKGISSYVTGDEIETNLLQSKNVEAIEKFRVLQEKMHAFNVRYGLRNDLHQIFNAYLTRRKQVSGIERVDTLGGTSSCPRISMWVLNREQLEKIGVRGIEDFWFPKTKREKEALIPEFGQSSDPLYFGESEGLTLYCMPGVKNWLNLQWYKLMSKS